MGLIYQPHKCQLPFTLTNGTIWECDRCGHVWRFHNPGNPNYAAWRRLGWLGRRMEGFGPRTEHQKMVGRR
jgi:hypothetical protein